MTRSIVVLLGVVLLLPRFAGADDELAIDLRGPDPKPGLNLREVGRFEMKGADLTLTDKGKLLATVKMDLTTVGEYEVTVKTTEGRAVTKFTTRIVKDETTTSTRDPEGTETTEDLGALSGQMVTSEKTESGWKHTLADGEPSKEQKEALADMGPWDDEEYIPSGKQKVGATWEVDAVHFKKFLGESWTAASGKFKSTFTGIKKHDSELCAVIDSIGSLKVKLNLNDGNDWIATIELQMTEYRALKHGVTLKAQGEVLLKMSGKEEIEGNEIDAAIQGKANIEFETVVRDLGRVQAEPIAAPNGGA